MVRFPNNAVPRSVCWCVACLFFQGPFSGIWRPNSGLVEKLPSASFQVLRSLLSLVAAMLIALLDAATIGPASGCCSCEACPAGCIALRVLWVCWLCSKSSTVGTDAAFSARLLHASLGGLPHCGLCQFMVGATLMWSVLAGGLSVVVAQGDVGSWPLDPVL